MSAGAAVPSWVTNEVRGFSAIAPRANPLQRIGTFGVSEAKIDHSALIVACGRGDRAALRQIYQSEAGAMIGIAARIVKRRELAEEVVQEAFVTIWRNAARFDPSIGSGRAWLFQIVRNRALNMLRDSSRELPTEQDAIDAAVDADADSENAFERLANNSALKRCLDELEPRRRQGVLLAFVEGMSHGEIAAKLKVPLGTTKSWLRRSLIALRECMT
ncbi:MAG: sigma-70 family RNA polymerase sigma factor [Xanthobacteraceae bacterium]|nr:sigma-70 family RNA polymerase sigma factor [Xanthobacteraceae bacterium]MCW5677423.1 sigma-70 family RNA polymerase sigma factor [Xanthobacteraceae bacterium]